MNLDLRERVVGAISGGLSCRGAARRFDISPSMAICYQQRMKRTSCVVPFNAGVLLAAASLPPIERG